MVRNSKKMIQIKEKIIMILVSGQQKIIEHNFVNQIIMTINFKKVHQYS